MTERPWPPVRPGSSPPNSELLVLQRHWLEGSALGALVGMVGLVGFVSTTLLGMIVVGNVPGALVTLLAAVLLWIHVSATVPAAVRLLAALGVAPAKEALRIHGAVRRGWTGSAWPWLARQGRRLDGWLARRLRAIHLAQRLWGRR